MKLSYLKCEILKIINFLVISWHFTPIICIYYVFWTFGISVLARGALRDLRYFFSTNNLRIVKSFLEVESTSLIGEM